MTEEQRDEILLEIANKVDFNTKQIEAINMTMSNHSLQIEGIQGSIYGLQESVSDLQEGVSVLQENVSVLQENVSVLQESVSTMQEDIKGMKKTIDNHSRQISENTEELIRQRQNIAKLEFDMSNKIDILFDAISVYQDKDLEYKKEFNSINRVLENLDKRVFILESNN